MGGSASVPALPGPEAIEAAAAAAAAAPPPGPEASAARKARMASPRMRQTNSGTFNDPNAPANAPVIDFGLDTGVRWCIPALVWNEMPLYVEWGFFGGHGHPLICPSTHRSTQDISSNYQIFQDHVLGQGVYGVSYLGRELCTPRILRIFIYFSR